MLIPKYAVSSRDECVLLGVMTVKESSTQLYYNNNNNTSFISNSTELD